MTLHKALHPRNDVDRLYVSRKEWGRGLASIEVSIDAAIQRLGDYIEKHGEKRITAIRNDSKNTMANRMTITAIRNDSKNTMANRMTITAIRNDSKNTMTTEWQYQENKNGKKMARETTLWTF